MHERILGESQEYATETEIRNFVRGVTALFDERGGRFVVNEYPWNGSYRARVPQPRLQGLGDYGVWEYCDVEVDPEQADKSGRRDLMFNFIQSGINLIHDDPAGHDTLEKNILIRGDGSVYIDVSSYNQASLIEYIMALGEGQEKPFRSSKISGDDELEALEYEYAAAPDALTCEELFHLKRLVGITLS